MSVRLERCLFPEPPVDATVELHVFGDASEIGYGAVTYLRFKSDSGMHCRFVSSKSRVAPKKFTTIPRLELVAAVLAAKLMRTTMKELKFHIDRVVLWTDSTIVLQYIRNNTIRLATFVANRVRIIRDLSVVDQWRYVPSGLKPADVASRRS